MNLWVELASLLEFLVKVKKKKKKIISTLLFFSPAHYIYPIN